MWEIRNVYVVTAVLDVGGVAYRNFLDASRKSIDMSLARSLCERDMSFKNTFGFDFPRSLLEMEGDQWQAAMDELARRCIEDEVANIEWQNRIVRLNPIFQGREFLLDDHLVFVLSPFEEPFNTIYSDHIKPSIESIAGLGCLRADDIYDNRPIIEDIWRCTNQAKIIVAELTGKNANVFYETGIAHTIGKEVVLITQSMDDVPFDLRHRR